MIKVYLLPVITIDGAEAVAGSDLIHDAILDTTADPGYRLLIMDVSPSEDAELIQLAVEVRDPTQAEIDHFNSTVIPLIPDPDTIRAQEILATSPDAITQPEIWELLRIFGRRLGYLA